MKVALCGSHGKMGKEFLQTFSKEYQIIEINQTGCCLNDIISHVQLVIDFTNGSAAFLHGVIALTHDIPIIIGSTGLQDAHKYTLKNIADSRNVGCIISSNFSIGMLWIKRNVNEISPYFQSIRIIEEHHKSKVDTPSGTALVLKDILQISDDHIESYRGDSHKVKHTVILENEDEVITIEHIVKSRSAYMTRLRECIHDIFLLHTYIELE